jgi:hypothetical protein
MAARTTAQRIAALDVATWMIENLELDREPEEVRRTIALVVEDLRLYRSWNDRPDDDDGFFDIHDRLAERFIAAMAAADSEAVIAVLLDSHTIVAELWDSVPWPRRGVRARVRGALDDGLSIMWWADLIGRMPKGDVRDLAAYALDLVHTTLGEHDSGDECQAVNEAFTKDETTVVHRLVQPVYQRVLYWLPLV